MVKSMIAAGAIPHFHLCDELDMRALLDLRNQIKGDSVLQGVHLTFLPVMIKVSIPSSPPPSPLKPAPPPVAKGEVLHNQQRPQMHKLEPYIRQLQQLHVNGLSSGTLPMLLSMRSASPKDGSMSPAFPMGKRMSSASLVVDSIHPWSRA